MASTAANKSSDGQPSRFPPSPPREESHEEAPVHPDNNDDNTNLEFRPTSNPTSSLGTGKVDVSVPGTLGLVPLLPSSNKNKRLEVKRFPIVLGRTNLAQWWYQSCDCQHYYCRFHCRPVAQSIGSLSKVMIQIDSTGMVHLVGKNPHLVTITPERGGQILQVNDILSIGRRDREPWMRFQVVSTTDAPTIAAHKLGITDEPAPKRPKQPNNSADDNARDVGGCGSDRAGQNTNHGGSDDRNSSNKGSSLTPRDGLQSEKVVEAVPSMGQQHQQPVEYQHQPPEWITTTRMGSRNLSQDRSSVNNDGRYISTKQQQHLAIVSRLAKAAAAAAAANAQGLDAKHQKSDYFNATDGVHKSNESDPHVGQRKRSRGRSTRGGSNIYTFGSETKHYHGGGGNGGGNFSSKAIRSADDLYVGSLHRRDPHHPQIHLVFQDYETSARLVGATQRGQYSQRDYPGTDQPERTSGKQHIMRQPRTDQNFISKPPLHRPETSPQYSHRDSDGVEGGDQERIQEATQLGILSKNFEAALLRIDSVGDGSMNKSGNGYDNDAKSTRHAGNDVILGPHGSTQLTLACIRRNESEQKDDAVKTEEEFMRTTDNASSAGQILSKRINLYASDGSPREVDPISMKKDPAWIKVIEKAEEPQSVFAATDGASLPPLLDDEIPAEPKQDC